jgi:hypothetical protein
MSKTYYFKQLRLAPADVLNQMGIPAEAPAFLSPVVDLARHCRVCPISYTPLVYQTGQVTYAQHYHATVGGIYFIVRHQLHLELLSELTGWFAEIEPLGKTAIYCDDSSRRGRSEAVRCIAISAWCMGHNESHALESGLLFVCPFSRYHPGMFVPVCDQCAQEDLPAKYMPLRFQIRDGTVFYTQRHLS